MRRGGSREEVQREGVFGGGTGSTEWPIWGCPQVVVVLVCETGCRAERKVMRVWCMQNVQTCRAWHVAWLVPAKVGRPSGSAQLRDFTLLTATWHVCFVQAVLDGCWTVSIVARVHSCCDCCC